METLAPKKELSHKMEKFLTFKNNFFGKIMSLGGSPKLMASSKLLFSIASKNSLANQVEIFRQGRRERDGMLLDFCTEGLRQGYSAEAIAWTIIKYRYAHEVSVYADQSRDQASQINGLDDTIRISWGSFFGGDTPIVESVVDEKSGNVSGGIRLDGSFCKSLTCKHSTQERTDEVPDTLYLLEHAIAHELPQPPWIRFGDKVRKEKDLPKAWARAVAHRNEFQENLPGVRGDHFEIGDSKHNESVKFRTVMMIMNMESGQLLVVSEKDMEGNTLSQKEIASARKNGHGEWVTRTGKRMRQPQSFMDWVPGALNDILSSSDEDISKMHEIIGKGADAPLEGRLLHELLNPRNGKADYKPWSDLKKYVKENMPLGNDGSWYKQANKIWRAAMIERQLENVRYVQENYNEVRKGKESVDRSRGLGGFWLSRKIKERNYSRLRMVEDIVNSVCVKACDDGRQKGNVKVLGAILSKDEFMMMFNGKSKVKTRSILNTLHYDCGFLSACHDIDRAFAKLKVDMDDEWKEKDGAGGYSVYNTHMGFFKDSIRDLFNPNKPKPQFELLRKHLPAKYHSALDYVRMQTLASMNEELKEKVEVPGKIKESSEYAIAETLYSLFLGNSDKLRSVVRRGVKVGVLEMDSQAGFVGMPCAQSVYARIESYFGDEFASWFDKTMINAFVIEETAMWDEKRMGEWMKELPMRKRVPIVSALYNFYNGKWTIIPGNGINDYGRFSQDDNGDTVYVRPIRYDHMFTNMFDENELNELGIHQGQKIWVLPYPSPVKSA